MVFSVIRHARPKYTFVSVFNVNFFISHKKDIIFAWPCKYSAINLGSLAYIGGYKFTYTRAHHLVCLLFFYPPPQQFQFHPVFRILKSMMPFRTVFSNIYTNRMADCISHSTHPPCNWKFQFYFAFTSDDIPKVACCNMVVCSSFTCRYFWSSCRSPSFSLSLASFTMFQYGFSIWSWVAVWPLDTAISSIYLESTGLYSDLCVQCSTFCILYSIQPLIHRSRMNGVLLQATNHPDSVHLPAKIIWKYIPVKLTSKISTNLLVVCSSLCLSPSRCPSKHEGKNVLFLLFHVQFRESIFPTAHIFFFIFHWLIRCGILSLYKIQYVSLKIGTLRNIPWMRAKHLRSIDSKSVLFSFVKVWPKIT